MKTHITAFAAIVAVLAGLAITASCQKETPETYTAGSTDNQSEPGKLTATIAQTKVTYAETEELNLHPSWEVGDEIIGFDDAGNTYTLTVEAVEAEIATLSGSAPDGALHLIYKSGAKASDVSSKTLAIDYTAQKGDKTMPAVMLADGTVKDGACAFTFNNADAIIGISAVKGVPSGSAISKITVSGENLSGATVALSGSVLKLTATIKTGDAISIDGLDLTVTDANGTLSAPVFIAVPAGAKIAKVSTALQARVPETMTIPSTAADKKDIDYVEIEAKYDGTNLSIKKWAKWNVGANSEKDYGWYFAWADTEGYVWKNSQWVSSSGVDTYSYALSSVKTALAGGYLYVKTQSFTGHSFDWAHAPFNNGSSSYDATYFSSVRSTVCPSDILAKEYDAATVNWGDTWRMPTSAEFQALYDATKWTWDSTDKGYYITKKGEALSADKSNALLFFPAAGYGDDASFLSTRVDGRYWSSTLDSFDPSYAYRLLFYSGEINPQYSYVRYRGFSVRPLSVESVVPKPLPAGALPGEFSVSPTKKVHFSKGNLWADGSNALHFEDAQWKSSPEYGGLKDSNHVSYFTWSDNVASAVGNANSVNNIFCDENHKVSVDNSGAIYYALSTAEWQYLLSYDGSWRDEGLNYDNDTRHGRSKCGVFVCGKPYCVVIAPDDWDLTANPLQDGYNSTTSPMTWEQAEAAGLVCLPAVGYCYGSSVSEVGNCGFYWSSSACPEDYASCVRIDRREVLPDHASPCNFGHSVRLITECQ